MREYCTRANLLGLAILLSVSGCGAPARMMQGPLQESEQERTAKRLDRLAAWARVESRVRPWDWRAKALELGDPVRIYAFVRDEIAFEPYEGAMRGSTGTLLSRGGNALEKAQLLRDMLGAVGVETRLVSGTLPPDRCEKLLRSFAERDPLPRESPSDDARMLKIAADLGLAAEDVLRVEGKTRAEREVERAELLQSTDREVAFLRGRLAEAGITLGAEPMFARLREMVSRHFWVRRRDSDRWIDTDPTSDGGERPVELSGPEARLVHRVEFRVLITQSAQGKEKEVEVLSAALPAPDSVVEPVRFAILPSDPRMPDPSKLSTLPGPEVRGHLAKCDRFQALLSRGKRRWFSLAWDRQGRTFRPAGGKLQEMIRDFGMDLEDPTGEKPKPKLTKVRIELRLVGPSGTRIQERVLFDDAPLRKNDLLTVWDLVIVAHPFPVSYDRYLSAASTAAMASLLAHAIRGKPGWPSPEIPPTSGALSFVLDRQEEWRRRLSRMDAAERPATLWTAIGLVISKQNYRMRQEQAWKCTALDVVAPAPLRVERSGEMKMASGANLLAGVVDSCLEEMSVPACARTGHREGTVAYFAVRRIEGRGATAVARRGELDRASMPGYTRRWIAEAERGSCVAIFPADWKEGEEFHWWSVDVATGASLGRGWDGEGGADWTWLQYEATAEWQSIFLILSGLLCIGAVWTKGGGFVATACCLGLAYWLYHKVQLMWMNLLLMVWSVASTFVPEIDPCWYLVKALWP